MFLEKQRNTFNTNAADKRNMIASTILGRSEAIWCAGIWHLAKREKANIPAFSHVYTYGDKIASEHWTS
jgi:hypothetical protein